MDHWQARPRGLRLIVREPAWRLNAYRSFSMTDSIKLDRKSVSTRD